MTTAIVLVILLVCVYFAIRSMRKQKGCGSGCSGCAHADGCPAKAIQQLVDESKRRKIQ
ncbi:FeoB-associated Cys-rich membrane protein [uncultured Traorella sp.]|uniref:FeoB-associated Cys-rich membrane protein n=1 Tax=uncultured Traorella sp. TaxID=1929048 RepID=UPI0025FE26F6|nr:FeoB-associated Cys-rich membrane protein [uncultured Traorella sp.]